MRNYALDVDVTKPSEILWLTKHPPTPKIFNCKNDFIAEIYSRSFVFRNLQQDLNEIFQCPLYADVICGSARHALYISKDVQFYSEAIGALIAKNPTLEVPERSDIIKDICEQFADCESYRLISLLNFFTLMPSGGNLIQTLRAGGITQVQLLDLTKQGRKGKINKCRVIGIIATKITGSKRKATFAGGAMSVLTVGANFKYYFVYSHAECRHKMLSELIATTSIFVQKSLLRRNEPLPHCFGPDFEFDEDVIVEIRRHLGIPSFHAEVLDDDDATDTQTILNPSDVAFTFFCVNDVSIAQFEDCAIANDDHSVTHYPQNQQVFMREESMERFTRSSELRLSGERFPPASFAGEIWPEDEFDGRTELSARASEDDDDVQVLEEGGPMRSPEAGPSCEIEVVDCWSLPAKRGRFMHAKVNVADDDCAGPSAPRAQSPSGPPPFSDDVRREHLQKLIYYSYIFRQRSNLFDYNILARVLQVDSIYKLTAHAIKRLMHTCSIQQEPPNFAPCAIVLLNKKKIGEYNGSDFGFVIQKKICKFDPVHQSQLKKAIKYLVERMMQSQESRLPRMVVGVGENSLLARIDSSDEDSD